MALHIGAGKYGKRVGADGRADEAIVHETGVLVMDNVHYPRSGKKSALAARYLFIFEGSQRTAAPGFATGSKAHSCRPANADFGM
jgi:hypothetical protein